MHPEVTSDKPGRCSKCGMPLVEKGHLEESPKASPVEDNGLGEITWKSYLPLIVIISLLLISALIVSLSAMQIESFLASFLLSFMTGFFIVFGGFKLLDLKGFAEGYSTYDLLAQRWFAYGYIFPFIELSFGFLMLSGFHPTWFLWTEFVLMAFSGLGVVIKLAKHEKIQCVCLGTMLKVPLTYVTLVEDFGMAVLALGVLALL